jgi:hypothetical protein
VPASSSKAEKVHFFTQESDRIAAAGWVGGRRADWLACFFLLACLLLLLLNIKYKEKRKGSSVESF